MGLSRGKGYDQRIRPRHWVYGLRWCCSETRIFLLRSRPLSAPIVFGIPSSTVLAEDKKRFQFATAGRAYTTAALEVSAVHGMSHSDRKRRRATRHYEVLPSFAATLRHPACSPRKALAALLRICGPYSVAHLLATLAQHGTFYLFAYCQPHAVPSVCKFIGLIRTRCWTGSRPFLHPTRLVHLDIIFWHTLLCNIPLHHVLSFYRNTLMQSLPWHVLTHHACGHSDTKLSTCAYFTATFLHTPIGPSIRPPLPVVFAFLVSLGCTVDKSGNGVLAIVAIFGA